MFWFRITNPIYKHMSRLRSCEPSTVLRVYELSWPFGFWQVFWFVNHGEPHSQVHLMPVVNHIGQYLQSKRHDLYPSMSVIFCRDSSCKTSPGIRMQVYRYSLFWRRKVFAYIGGFSFSKPVLSTIEGHAFVVDAHDYFSGVEHLPR